MGKEAALVEGRGRRGRRHRGDLRAGREARERRVGRVAGAWRARACGSGPGAATVMRRRWNRRRTWSVEGRGGRGRRHRGDLRAGREARERPVGRAAGHLAASEDTSGVVMTGMTRRGPEANVASSRCEISCRIATESDPKSRQNHKAGRNRAISTGLEVWRQRAAPLAGSGGHDLWGNRTKIYNKDVWVDPTTCTYFYTVIR